MFRRRGLPEQHVRRALRDTKRRHRLEASLDALIAGSAAAGVVLVLGTAPVGALVVGIVASVASGVVMWRRLTDARIAQQIESDHPALQNLLITAQEALAGRAIHPVVSREVFAQTAERLLAVDTSMWTRGAFKRLSFAIASVVAVGLLIGQGPLRRSPMLPAASAADANRPVQPGATLLRVTVIPPAYTRRAAVTTDNPVQVQALDGSTIRLHVPGAGMPVQLVEPGREPQMFGSTAEGAVLEFSARRSRVFLLRPVNAESVAGSERLVQLQVRQDARPIVTIDRPGRDLLFGTASGSIPIVITARDDLNLAAVMLRYTRIAGSGETFTFEEGELPLRISPTGPAPSRAATGTLVLDHLKLEDGDTLVYRALARDDRPGADPATSESFLIEIGKRGEASSTGFLLPDDRARQGLSQQMLIIKTERLRAERPKLTAEAALEQSRLLAVEQRMVRAEFLFMTGGEVVDEVEEAEHSHELAAGRFENEGQVELLNAIREMSRAEARLNVGDTTQALAFERAALGALERAFDRRRYFLRTLPERARIDPSRRLTGDVSVASPAAPLRRNPPIDPVVQEIRDTMAALSRAIQSQSGLDAELAARAIALDPESAALQLNAARLSSGGSLEERATAAAQARAHFAGILRERLAPAPAQKLLRDPLTGFLTREGRR
jgi:hypothetical protein